MSTNREHIFDHLIIYVTNTSPATVGSINVSTRKSGFKKLIRFKFKIDVTTCNKINTNQTSIDVILVWNVSNI